MRADGARLPRPTSSDTAPSPPTAWRYQHSGLDELASRPPAERGDLTSYLSDKECRVAATAAIGIVRSGHYENPQRLAAQLANAIENESLPQGTRCAAVEALAMLPSDTQIEYLRKLIDRFGSFRPGAFSRYQADLHAELLCALARHVEASSDPRFLTAVRSPSYLVRIETLRAWGVVQTGTVPNEVLDLRSDGDPRVRSAAFAAIASQKLPSACDYLTAGLHDVDLQTRLAAIRGLGRLQSTEAKTTLTGLLKDRSELVRAEAVAALAVARSRTLVLGAASDTSWRVRLKVAEALTDYGDPQGALAAVNLLRDPSAEVERQAVKSVSNWPMEIAGTVLLDALARDAISVRKIAADQLTSRWPSAETFPVEASPSRRSDVLKELQKQFHARFPTTVPPSVSMQPDGTRRRDDDVIPTHAFEESSPTARTNRDEQVAKLVSVRDIEGLIRIGPTVGESLERLVAERHLTLDEEVYRNVLPRYDPTFAILDRLHGGGVDDRRKAAEELAAVAQKRPLGNLAAARMCELVTAEPDALVWLTAIDSLANNNTEPAERLARTALGHDAAEVRRRTCDYFKAHPSLAQEPFLTPLLNDPQQLVVISAIRALGAIGHLRNSAALKRQLGASSEEIQTEAALALLRIGDTVGVETLERLSYSNDVKTRAHVARAIGALTDTTLVATLIRLLDDSRATVSHAALASLPKLVGLDVAASSSGVPLTTVEQMKRWKAWFAGKK